MILLLALLAGAAAGAVIDVLAKEQYVAVMRAEEYVQPDGSPNTAPSLFIGLIHVAVTPNPDGSYGLGTTVWHDVAKATIIYISGPAQPGSDQTRFTN